MNICDSTRPMRRMLGVLGQVIAETTYRSFRGFARELPPLYALFCWALIMSISLLMVSGCGRYKDELESAKQQNEKLNSEVKRLTEEVVRLNQEKSQLSDDSKTLSDNITQMQREFDNLNRSKASLSEENKEIRKKNSIAEEAVASLRSENARLAQEVEELKKRVGEMAASPKSSTSMQTEVVPQSQVQLDKLTPCDAVLAFMKASEAIVREQKGTERTKSLEQVKKQYAPRMKGAPEKAIKAADNWVKAGSKLWDQSYEDSYRVLELRNDVLEACGKSPREAGF